MTDSCVLLFDLPEAITKQIIVEWLYMHDIIHLDSALCNGKLRSLFAGLVYGHRTTFSVEGCGTMYKDSNKFDGMIRWAVLRNAELDGIHVNQSKCGCNRLLPTFLTTNGTAVRWVASSSGDVTSAKQQQTLVEIARECPHVERLYVDSKEPTSQWDSCLLDLTQTWPRLTVLSLCNVALSEEGLIAAVNQCSHLEKLVIRNAEQAIPIWVISSKFKTIELCSRYVSDVLLVDISQQCKQLEVLKVFESSERTVQPLITDVGVRAILWGCPLLRETDVEFARGISNHLRVELARRRNDTSLHCLWRGMSEELAQAVLDGCPRINEVYFYPGDWLTDAALAACVRNRPQLETIGLIECSGVTNDGVSAVMSAPGNRFRKVDLRWCPQLGDAALSAVATHCPLLDSVTLSKCPLVTDSGAVALAVSIGARLRSLDLGNCTQLGDKTVNAVAEHCPLLQEFRYSYTVSVAAEERLWDRCVHLKRKTQAERRADSSRRLLELRRPAPQHDPEWMVLLAVLALIYVLWTTIDVMIRG
jgi:hypothetical protein